jgi:hypothetical protein
VAFFASAVGFILPASSFYWACPTAPRCPSTLPLAGFQPRPVRPLLRDKGALAGAMARLIPDRDDAATVVVNSLRTPEQCGAIERLLEEAGSRKKVLQRFCVQTPERLAVRLRVVIPRVWRIPKSSKRRKSCGPANRPR